MDNSDIFILNGRKFYLSETEAYEINLNSIRHFIEENITNMPKMISFIDKIFFICKKTTPVLANDLLQLVSAFDKSTYLVKACLSSIVAIKEEEKINYYYLIDFYEKALVNINTEFSAVESAKLRLLSDTMIHLYGNHINNQTVSSFVIDNVVKRYDIVKKILPQLESTMVNERNIYKISFLFKKIVANSISLDLSTADMCCKLLHIVRKFSANIDVKDMIVMGKNKHKNINIMIRKINDGVFDVEDDFVNELNKINNSYVTDQEKKTYYANLFLKIIEIYKSTDDVKLKKCCAYELAKYVYSDALFLNGTIYLQYSDITKKIIFEELGNM